MVVVGMTVEFVGPFAEEWRVTVDGYRVPHLSAIVKNDGSIMLLLDERFCIEGSREEISKWVWFVADAMAIGAGYSCLGENCRQVNPYQVQMSGIEINPSPTLTLVQKEPPP